MELTTGNFYFSSALSDEHAVVRNAALFALGQFAEHLQVRHTLGEKCEIHTMKFAIAPLNP
jgi:hypothetical protein